MPTAKPMFKVFQIDHTSKLLNDVIALGDANKSTLGLFPKEAYKESASKKWIIIAIDEITGNLAGYLLFNASRRKMLISIVHLCVDSSWRGRGISKLLFNELKRITEGGFLGVRVRCRIDYPANGLWPKLGFVAMGEMNGRAKKESRLTIWKYEYAHPSLFTYASLQNENAKVRVVIDANVFYQLQHPEIPEHEESLPLLEPWLDIDLCITPELLNEINRNKDKSKRELARKFASSFITVDSKTSQDRFQSVQEELRPLFPDFLETSDESDLRQLAYAISAEIPFFVTRDRPMLDRAEDVFEKFGIQILRPSDLILMQDELLRGDEYAPSRLAGTQIHVEKVHSQQSEKLIEKFLPNQGETKGAFNKKLQMALSNASAIETFVVMDARGEEYGLISYSRQFDNQIVVPIFRVGHAPICQYIAKYLVNNLVLTASAEHRSIVKISDDHLSEKIVNALRDSGFFQIQNGWVKIALHDVLSTEDIGAVLSKPVWSDHAKKRSDELLSILQSRPSDSMLLEVEKSLWPLKLKDINLPSFVVPIKPEWAMRLFDVDIASQDLFGGELSLILNAENVYYRSSFPKVLSAPGRILWYVSSGDNRYQGSMCLKASSYLDEVEIGKPKQLFSRYKKLGIYKWHDVYTGAAKGDLNKDIMAFKFSKTEVFKTPIHFYQLQEIWKAQGQSFNPIAPSLITNERFFLLYNMGTKGS